MRKVLLLAAIGAALLGFTGSSNAATSTSTPIATETQTYPDGSSATMSLVQTTGPTFAPGATTAAATSCATGYYGYAGTVKWSDIYGIVVWTYQMRFTVYVSGCEVRSVYELSGAAVDSCCGWSWAGVVDKHSTPLPYTSDIGYVKGQFDYCIPYCGIDTMYPWYQITIGNNGGDWAYKWGIG